MALIEVLANLKGNAKLFPDTYQLMKVKSAEDVIADVARPNTLPDDWREDLMRSRSFGDSWLVRRNSVLLAVPSVPAPESTNYLFNPLHPEAAGFKIEWCKWLQYDKRLFHIQME